MTSCLNEKHLPVNHFKWWYVLLAYAISVLVLIGLSVLGGVFGVDGSLGGQWASCLQFVLFAVFCVGCVWVFQGRPLASDWGLIGGQAKRILLFIFSFTFLFLVVSYTLEAIFDSMAKASRTSFLGLGLDGDASITIPMILTITVFAPIGEEFLYRGLMFRALRDGLTKYISLKNTILIAIVLSAFAFAFSHGNTEQKPQLGALVLMGVLLALAYQFTGSLFAPIMIHSLNNTSVLLIGAFMYKDAVSVSPVMLGLMAFGPVMTLVLVWGVSRVLPKVDH